MFTRVTEWLRGRNGACLTVGAVVFFSRAWLIGAWGSPVPYWDQWDAEGTALYQPWLDGTLRWADIFALHNEHRIALTRLSALALFICQGGWNVWSQLLLNALLHAGIAAALAAVFWPGLAPRTRGAFLFGLALIFASTCGWQNALWGFQSQFYFAGLLTVAAICGTIRSAPLSRSWWLGWLAGLLALFANAGGVLASACASAAAVGLAIFSNTGRRQWVAALTLVLLVALGFLLNADPAHHASLHAKTVAKFWAVFIRCLAWPHVDQGWLIFVTQAPLIWLAARVWQNRSTPDTTEVCALALGLFAILHATAVAHTRGGGLIESRPLSRYQDALLLGAAAQLFAVVRLASLGRSGRLVLIAWSASLLFGLLSLTETNLSWHLPYKRTQDRAALSAIRSYLSRGDATLLDGLQPSPAAVRQILDDRAFRSSLPAELQATTDDSSNRPIVLNHGKALTGAAILLLTFVICLIHRAPTKPASAR